jgi:hypothetical protein
MSVPDIAYYIWLFKMPHCFENWLFFLSLDGREGRKEFYVGGPI